MVAFPFGVDFQKSLLLLITKDSNFASLVLKYLKAEYFENEVLAWSYEYIVKYKDKYNAVPNLLVLLEESKNLPLGTRELYQITLEGVRESNLSSEEWIKDQTLDFIKRNIFVDSMRTATTQYNEGSITESYDTMREAMDNVSQTVWEETDREWFFENVNQRMADRLSNDPMYEAIATGIPELDKVLGGGLSIGEVGLWIAFSKRGKTTILTNHGTQAVRRGLKNTLHVVLEGSRQLVANRYDTIFAQEDYSLVKTGQLTNEAYQRIIKEYQMLKRRLVIRGFTERWDYTIEDIWHELKELKRIHDWVPSLIVLDYGDLLNGRGKYGSEEAKQRAAYQDIKSLAGKGFGIWTAAQAQRPKIDVETDATPLSYKNVADCYAKIQKVDFIGSINQTAEERNIKQARLFAELYRDNEANLIIPVHADFSKMTFKGLRTENRNVQRQPINLGYRNGVSQVRAPI